MMKRVRHQLNFMMLKIMLAGPKQFVLTIVLEKETENMMVASRKIFEPPKWLKRK